MILTDDMLAMAFQYRDTELWKVLTDSDVFAFRLSDGEVGYCCVMGNAGEHFALGFYRGRKGFSSYLKTIELNAMPLSDVEMFEMTMTFNCINCDFMQASEIDDEVKKLIRNYAETHKLKIRRPKGWPDFTRHAPFKMPFGITSEKDACDIIEAFRAAMAVAGELKHHNPVKLGFDEKGDYPTMKGGKPVPYLIPNADGTYSWDIIKLPAFLPDKWPALKFKNDILSNVVNKLRASGTLQIKLVHFPMSVAITKVDVEENEGAFFPLVLLVIDVENDKLYPIFPMEDEEDNSSQMLADFADNLRNNDTKPATIEVKDDRTELFLTDFCTRCGIHLSRKKELPELDAAYSFLINNFM